MIHRIFSDLPSFKNIELHSGLNVLLTDRTKDSTDLQTRNRAGKSSLIQIIHFVLGASIDTDSIFRLDDLKTYSFGLEFDLGEQRITVDRSAENYGRIIVRNAETSGWPIQPSSYRGIENSLSRDDWCSIIGEKFFGLRTVRNRDRENFSPTFRSLFSYFVRKENDGGFRRPQAQSSQQQLFDQQVAVAYLLGLDWKIPQDWEIVRQREKTLRELRRAAEAGAFGGIISSSGQLRTALVLAEEASQRIHDALVSFEVLPEYRELEQEASRITRALNDLSNQNTIDEQLIDEIQESFTSEEPPESDDLIRLFDEAGVTLPDIVANRFEDVKIFHDSIIANRRDYLSSELDSAQNRLQERRSQMQRLDSRRGEIMRILQSRRALDQFQELQRDAARQDAETESIRQRFQAAEQLEGSKTELEIERAKLTQRLRMDLDEQKDVVIEAITTFERVSHALYEQAGSLQFTPTENGLRTEIRIQGQLSRGIQNMQVVCFDLMLMQLFSKRNIGLGFLVREPSEQLSGLWCLRMPWYHQSVPPMVPP